MPYDFEADVQLLRAVLSTAAHDLGGLSSALALRTDVLAGALASADEQALRAVVDELHSLGRQLRVLRGPQGADALAPAGGRTLVEWLALVERFGRPLLGRGGALEGSVDDGAFSGARAAEQGHALLVAVLAYCHEVRERRGARSVTVHLIGRRVADGLELSLRAAWGEGVAGGDAPVVRRWLTHARDVVTAAGGAWEETNDGEMIVMRAPVC
jgi:hypothetical protein